MHHSHKKLLSASLLCVCYHTAFADDSAISATPYRPTLSNPAELSAPGWLELEGGWAREHDSSTIRQGMPYTAKLAFTPDWGILVGGELWAREQSDRTVSGHGDTSLTLKHRIATNDKDINFGIEAGVNLPTATNQLGSGKPDWTVNSIYSQDFDNDWRLDVNAGLTRFGVKASGTSNISALWAAALSKGLGNWGLAGELSGTHQNGTSDMHQVLGAVSYSLSPRVVVDGGLSTSFQGSQTSHAVFLGVTWLAGKVF